MTDNCRSLSRPPVSAATHQRHGTCTSACEPKQGGALMALFGNKQGGVTEANAQEESRQQLQGALQAKYQPALKAAQELGVRMQDVRMENGKLLIRGTAPSEDAKNKLWDQIKTISPNPIDLIADITVSPGQG